MDTIPITPYLGVAVGMAVLVIAAIGKWRQRRVEKFEWNNGICARSGRPWRPFDADSHGGRSYTDGASYCFISHKVDTPNPGFVARKTPARGSVMFPENGDGPAVLVLDVDDVTVRYAATGHAGFCVGPRRTFVKKYTH